MLKFFFKPEFSKVEIFTIAFLTSTTMQLDNLWIALWWIPVVILAVIIQETHKENWEND